MFFKIGFGISAILLSHFWATLAHAQWVHTTDIDAFTDNKTVMTTNIGRIIDGEKGRTMLVHRTQDGVSKLFWNTPDGFLCDVLVRGRIDGAEPFPISVTLSADRASVFFSDTRSIMESMIGSQTTRLKLTDSCGGYMVAEFIGNTDRVLPQYASALETQKVQNEQNAIKLASKTATISSFGWDVVSFGWDLVNAGTGQSNGLQKGQYNNFIQYKTDNVSLIYRKSQTPLVHPFDSLVWNSPTPPRTAVKTFHDLSFGIYDPELARPVKSMKLVKIWREFSKELEVRVGGKRFKAHYNLQWTNETWGPMGTIPNELTGAVLVYVKEPSKVEALYRELANPETESVKVLLKGKEYIIPVSNFYKAVEYYN